MININTANELKNNLENMEHMPLHIKANGGFGYGGGYIVREFDENNNINWVFHNGKIGGSFNCNDKFVLEALWNSRYYIWKELKI